VQVNDATRCPGRTVRGTPAALHGVEENHIMNTLNPPRPTYDKLARVLRHQRWLMVANAFVTFAVLFGAFGAVATLVS